MKRISRALLGCLVLTSLTATAAPAPSNADTDVAPSPVKAEETRPSVVAEDKDMWQQDYLTGNWGGNRDFLSDHGVTFGLNVIDEVLGNPSGGISQAAINGGRVEMALDLDFEKMAGLQGSSFHVNAYYIYGSDLSAGHIGNLLTVSNIEAYDTLRLFDLWYQQEFKIGQSGKVSLRFGQIAADDEFVISDYAATFMNGTFGWPGLTAINLPSGGPGYPLATPGVRLQVDPFEDLSFLAAVFDGDPGDRAANPQKADNHGTAIDFNQGFLTMTEAQYRVKIKDGDKELPGQYKLGGFWASQNFGDVARDDSGFSLADPASSGSPRAHSTDWGIYFVADQMVWKPDAPARDPKDMKSVRDPKDAKGIAKQDEDPRGLGLFWRIGGTPTDRNVVDFYTDGGLNYIGLIPGRETDVIGLGVGYAHISDDVRSLAIAGNNFTGVNGPIPDEEIAIELTYQAQIAPWWVVQPDIQYIVHPGGHVADPTVASGTEAIPDAVVVGVRTSISF